MSERPTDTPALPVTTLSVIQEPQMKPWLGWIKWVDPVFYVTAPPWIFVCEVSILTCTVSLVSTGL